MKVCIHIVSSRTKCLKSSLQSFYKHFNHTYDLPVYVYHFDDIYSDDCISDIHKTLSNNIKFIQVDYGLPHNLNFDDIYFVKQKNPSRIGYHHMCHFWSNFYEYPKTEYDKFDIAFNFDDDSLWINDFDYSYIDDFLKSSSVIMSFNVYRYDVNHRSRGVRTGLCSLVSSYCKKYNIVPKKKWMKELLSIHNEKEREDFFQTNLTCYDTNATKLSIYKDNNHKNWMKEVNASNGIYRFRWGDNEILSLYHDLHFDTDVFIIGNVKTTAGLTTNYIDPGGLRHITDYAPGVKFPRKIRDF